MSWRSVIISKRAKLELKMDYLVVRDEKEIQRVHLSEIAMLMIENTAVSLTAGLIAELAERKIKVVFCDTKRNPSCELVPYYGSHDTSLKVKQQIEWNKQTKDEVWTCIVAEKIRNQMMFLEEVSKSECKFLEEYIGQIELRDATNREGHAAKVYFNALFGKDFSRQNECDINKALNYGYGIILSFFNREVVSNGYITQLGLFHDNRFNHFNLSSDLMEPFRVLIDRKVYCFEKDFYFGKEEKMQLVNVLNDEVLIDGKRQFVSNAIKVYVRSVFDSLNENDISLMRFYEK